MRVRWIFSLSQSKFCNCKYRYIYVLLSCLLCFGLLRLNIKAKTYYKYYNWKRFSPKQNKAVLNTSLSSSLLLSSSIFVQDQTPNIWKMKFIYDFMFFSIHSMSLSYDMIMQIEISMHVSFQGLLCFSKKYYYKSGFIKHYLKG